VGLQPVLAIP